MKIKIRVDKGKPIKPPKTDWQTVPPHTHTHTHMYVDAGIKLPLFPLLFVCNAEMHISDPQSSKCLFSPSKCCIFTSRGKHRMFT